MNKLEQAARQALEALGSYKQPIYSHAPIDAAITALREALSEQAEQEPVALDEIRRIVAEYIEPNSQVDSGNLFWALCGALQYIDVNLKFSAIPAPVRTKDLTDEEIWATYDAYSSNLEFARAVIAKDREKNK